MMNNVGHKISMVSYLPTIILPPAQTFVFLSFEISVLHGLESFKLVKSWNKCLKICTLTFIKDTNGFEQQAVLTLRYMYRALLV